MIEMKSLTGQMLKRELGLQSAVKSFHNRNQSGGNFAFVLCPQKNIAEFQLYGHHDINGEIKDLMLIKLFQRGESEIHIKIVTHDNRKAITLEYAIEQIILEMNIM